MNQKFSFPIRRLLREADRPRGFSLVELMIAVALIAVLAAISAPSISNSMERGRVSDMNRAIANAFLETRSYAMRQGQAMFVEITVGADSELIFYEPANLGDAGSCVLAEDDGPDGDGENVLRRISPDQYGLDHELQAINPAGTSLLCISPNGRVVQPSSVAPEATGGCVGRNLVISIWDDNRGDGLDQCDLSDDTLVERELALFSMIHIAEGGQVKVSQ